MGSTADHLDAANGALDPELHRAQIGNRKRQEQARRYRKVMQRLERSNWFGVGITRDGTIKQVPVHVNGKNNPRPRIKTLPSGARIGEPMRLTQRHDGQHLAGGQATFHVSRSDRREALLALDIDGEEGTDWTQYGRRLVAAAGLHVVEVFVEPGRSYPRKGGCYIWFRVRYASGSCGPRRRLIERALNRRLKQATATIEPPEGIKFDGLKGCSSYIGDNPYFDAQYAAGDSGVSRREYQVAADVWMTAREAKRYLRAIGHDPEDIDSAVSGMPQRWTQKTNLQAYDDHRAFYKINEQQFRHDPRLERDRRHHGVLVTRPCYAAHSGTRDNNVEQFLDWADSSAGIITEARLLRLLGQDTRDQIDAMLDPARQAKRPPRASAPATPAADHDTPVPITIVSDIARVVDVTLDNHTRLCARVRVELRRLRRADADAQQIAAERAVQWYEYEGPATGDTPQEHAARLEWAGRIAQHFAASFDPSKMGAGPLKITAERIAEIAERQTGIIPSTMIPPAIAGRRLTRKQIAAVYLIVMHNIATGNIGEVPIASIRGMLHSMGMTMTNSQIAQAMHVLKVADQIEMTRDYSTCPDSGRGRCRKYVLGARAIFPAWAEQVITTEMRVACVAAPVSPASTTGRGAEAAPSPSPFQTTIWWNSLRPPT